MKPIDQPADFATVHTHALRLLARRDHSRHELQQKLRQRDAPADVIAAVLDRLAAEQLLDDARFAANRVRTRTAQGHGPQRQRHELLQHGVTAEVIAATLPRDPDQWLTQLQRVYRKRFGTAPPADAHQRAKCARFLAYRGFPSDLIYRFLATTTDDLSDSP